MEQRIKVLEAENAVLRFNQDYKIGTPVQFWTGLKEGAGRTGVTYTGATIVGGSAVVYLRDDGGNNAGCVCVSHVEPAGRNTSPGS